MTVKQLILSFSCSCFVLSSLRNYLLAHILWTWNQYDSMVVGLHQSFFIPVPPLHTSIPSPESWFTLLQHQINQLVGTVNHHFNLLENCVVVEVLFHSFLWIVSAAFLKSCWSLLYFYDFYLWAVLSEKFIVMPRKRDSILTKIQFWNRNECLKRESLVNGLSRVSPSILVFRGHFLKLSFVESGEQMALLYLNCHICPTMGCPANNTISISSFVYMFWQSMHPNPVD